MQWRGFHSFAGTAIKVVMLSAAVLFYVRNYNGAQLGLGRSNAHHPSIAAAPRDVHWPFMKRMMCPNQTPNPNVWSVLFELARAELDFPEEKITAHPSELIAQDSFFKFNNGGVGYAFNSVGQQHYMIYLRIFKAGSDQIQHNLQDILNPGYYEQWKSLSEMFAKSKALRSTVVENICVVTAVRDPVERFLSAYNEIEFKVEGRKKFGGDGTLHNYTRHDNGTEARFEHFVTDLVGGPRSAGLFGEYQRKGVQEITHIFSMTGILWGLRRLNDCYGEDKFNLTAYLPSLTNLETQFPTFLHDTCEHVPPFDTFNKRIVHDSQADTYNFYEAAKRSWRDEGRVARALCAIHALDYACYDALPIPPVCALLYSKDGFRQKIALVARKPKIKVEHCGQGNFP